MKSVQLRFESGFYTRWIFIVGMLLVMSLVPALLVKHSPVLKWVMPLASLLLGLLPWREWRIAAKVVDEEGVTRHDGRRFLWANLIKLLDVHRVSQYGQKGAFNHLDMVFSNGRARILLMALDNSVQAIDFVKKLHAKRTAPAASPSPAPAAPPVVASPIETSAPASFQPAENAKPAKCSICGDLGDCHRGLQTVGRESEDTFLPEAAEKLKRIKDVDVGRGRPSTLLQCPECGSWFLFKTTYEYLVYGSEDEQELSRISGEQAEELLRKS